MVTRPYYRVLFFLVALSSVLCQDNVEVTAAAAAVAVDAGAPIPIQPLDATVNVNQSPTNGTGTRKHKKKVVPTCEELLQDTKAECLRTVPPGYDPAACIFSWIENEDCDWEFVCQTILLEDTTPEPTTTEEPESSESEESCETDRKIKFSNCFINIDGFVKHSKAPLCD